MIQLIRREFFVTRMIFGCFKWQQSFACNFSPPPGFFEAGWVGTPTAQVGEGKECEDQEEQPAEGRDSSHLFHGAARIGSHSSPIW